MDSSRSFGSPKPGCNQDRRVEDVVAAGYKIRIIADGHGGQEGKGLFAGISRYFHTHFMDPLVAEIQKEVEDILWTGRVMSLSNIKDVAEAVRDGLEETLPNTLARMYKLRTSLGGGFATSHCGTTCTIVLSRGEEHVAIWIGDSPVYSLETGEILTPPNGRPDRELVNKHIPKGWDLMAFRAYARAMFPMDVAVQHSGVGIELFNLNKGMAPERFPEALNALWKVYPWQVSEPFTDRFIVASDGIDQLLPREPVTAAERLPRLRELATSAIKVFLETIGSGSSLRDDITFIVVGEGLNQWYTPTTSRVEQSSSHPEQEEKEEFFPVPGSP